MRTLPYRMFVFQLLLLISFPLTAENRSALLVANGAYKSFGSLSNPIPEARQLKGVLENLGFAVTIVENASRENMMDALADFELSLKSRGGVALFHYGGHGVQVGGKNYLIPADADIPDERRVVTRAVDLDEVMATLDASGSETNIVILDACRNNPLPASAGRSATRGLAVVGVKPKNSIIVYSSESGTVAQDGLFTPALAHFLSLPDLSLAEVIMRVRTDVYKKSNGAQTPGAYDQLFGPIFLNGNASAAPAASGQPPASTGAGPTLSVTLSYGSLAITTLTNGKLYIDGSAVGDLSAGSKATLDSVTVGERSLELRYADGQVERKSATVAEGESTSVAFIYHNTPSLKIGDVGPAGGIVFYDKGQTTDGWRYLEAAPSDNGTGIMWNNRRWTNIKTDTAVGSGKANTAAIIANQGAGSYAAQLCQDLVVNGYDDWFLPSQAELDLMYINLKNRGLGSFADSYYWSSSQFNFGFAWRQNFANGVQFNWDKADRYMVRAVRAF